MIGLVILLYATFGFTFTLGKVILTYASPFFIVASRMVVAGCALSLYARYKHHDHFHSLKRDWWLYVQYIFFGIVFFYCGRAWALQYLSTAKVALLFTLLPFFTALFSYIFHKEQLTLQKLFGLTLGLVGMLPVLTQHDTAATATAWGWAYLPLPELVTIASVASISYGMLIMRTLVRHHNVPPMLANGFSMLIAGIISLSGAALVEPVWIKQQPMIFAAISIVQIILSNIVCQNLQAYLLRFHSPTFMAFAGFLSPLCAACYGWLLLGEQITWHYALSFGMVILGLAIYYFDEIKAGNVH